MKPEPAHAEGLLRIGSSEWKLQLAAVSSQSRCLNCDSKEEIPYGPTSTYHQLSTLFMEKPVLLNILDTEVMLSK